MDFKNFKAKLSLSNYFKCSQVRVEPDFPEPIYKKKLMSSSCFDLIHYDLELMLQLLQDCLGI